MDCDREHSGADCGKIHCSLLCRRDFMFRGWGRVRSRYDWWYVRYCILQEIGNGFNCACCSFPISEEIYLGFWLAQDVYKISKWLLQVIFCLHFWVWYSRRGESKCLHVTNTWCSFQETILHIYNVPLMDQYNRQPGHEETNTDGCQYFHSNLLWSWEVLKGTNWSHVCQKWRCGLRVFGWCGMYATGWSSWWPGVLGGPIFGLDIWGCLSIDLQ